MTNQIARYHFSMSNARFQTKKSKRDFFDGDFGTLDMREIEATPGAFKPLVDLVGNPWGWNNKDMNADPKKLKDRLSNPETRLFMLTDNEVDIGYTIVTKPADTVREKFFKASNDIKIIEIENLGLFPHQEGGGRGSKFFEMVMDMLFEKYDHVYWSMSSTNHSGLFNYYHNKMGMTFLGTDHVDDFRPTPSAKIA